MPELMNRPRSPRISIGVTVALVWGAWLLLMVQGSRFGLFPENWFMSVTMALGSFIAGATSEGGGAVAFPVMTLGFKIPPAVARDFSLMIQAVGMTAASITILWTRTPVVRQALIWSTLGGALGIIFGLEFVAPKLQPAYAKMLFTASWLAFAVALFWINRYRDREVHTGIQRFLPRHAILLIGFGAVGRVISSVTGSGLDIVTFSLLVLRLRISEAIATPTSVILMAGNAVVGAIYRGAVQGELSPAAWNFWWVCVPIVVVGAPFGAWFIRSRSRLFVARLLYGSIFIQFIAAVLIIPQSPRLVGFSVATFSLGVLGFWYMARKGVRRLEWLKDPNEPR
ncbi:MAG: sulfite exporter TauE/SafE family protein [Planctomycetota bacterium]|nr:sulfite exporter TauE/SafE family protein [Planctomycetota bacterium]